MAQFQDLKLKVDEMAQCNAGYPKKSLLIVKCIKDFDNKTTVDNPRDYIKFVDTGKYGILTSHWISSDWKKVKWVPGKGYKVTK